MKRKKGGKEAINFNWFHLSCTHEIELVTVSIHICPEDNCWPFQYYIMIELRRVLEILWNISSKKKVQLTTKYTKITSVHNANTQIASNSMLMRAFSIFTNSFASLKCLKCEHDTRYMRTVFQLWIIWMVFLWIKVSKYNTINRYFPRKQKGNGINELLNRV